jgi:hypothetical protein
MRQRIKLTIEITLSSLDNHSYEYGFFDDSPHLIKTFFVIIPAGWLENETLGKAYLINFYNYFSGLGLLVEKGFKGDVMFKAEVELLTDEQRNEWMGQRKCYLTSLDGAIFEIFPREF